MLRSIGSIFAVGVAIAQAQDAHPDPPRFEVAVIHPSRPEGDGESVGCPTRPGLVRCTNVTLKSCIVAAYGVQPDRVLGGPEWIDADRFQITARAEKPVGDQGLMAMMQALLADRFRLTLHRELRSSEIMVLDVARGGPKFQPAPADAKASWKNLHDHLEAEKVTMSEFVGILSRNLNLPVEDHTGLAGGFNFTLRWNPTDANVHDRDEVFAILRLEVSVAVVKQLGLTLKPRQAPVQILMIDHAEKPTLAEN